MSSAGITEATRKTGVPAKQMYEELQPYMERAAEDHPHYHRWWQESGGADLDPERLLDAGFAFGLERLLDGLGLWPARRAE